MLNIYMPYREKGTIGFWGNERELESVAREIVCVCNVRAEGALQIYHGNSSSKFEFNLKL